MGNFKLIYLEWCDSIEGSGNWLSLNDAKEWCENEDWVIRQVSFLIKETDEYLFLASKINPQKDGEVMVGGTLKIPLTWIRKKVIIPDSIFS